MTRQEKCAAFRARRRRLWELARAEKRLAARFKGATDSYTPHEADFEPASYEPPPLTNHEWEESERARRRAAKIIHR